MLQATHRIPGLFRTFAAVEPTEAGVLEFVNKYGLLDYRTEPYDQSLPPWFEFYCQEISDMKDAVWLWDAIQRYDREALSAFKWEGNSDSDVDEEGWRFHHGDPFRPALFNLQRRVNKQLKTWGMTPRLTATEDRSHLRLCLIPKNLLTAIWLEFAESIDEQTRFLQCGGCGKWLPMPVHTTRDRRYCAEACRMRAMRGRKFKAHELAKQGVPAPQIAEQLGSKIAVVKKWIKEPAPLQRRAQNRA
jgi:hypothetical protein